MAEDWSGFQEYSLESNKNGSYVCNQELNTNLNNRDDFAEKKKHTYMDKSWKQKQSNI